MADHDSLTYRTVVSLETGCAVGVTASSSGAPSLATVEAVVARLAEWQHELGRPELHALVPTSVEVLEGPVAPAVVSMLARYGVRPSTLVLEVPERALVHRGTVDVQRQALRAAGVRVAVGHVGTGAVSLADLRRWPLDLLTVDVDSTAVLGGMLRERTLTAVVRDVADALGVPLVAVGVEHDAHLPPAVAMGCDLATGPLFGDAVPAEEVPAHLEQPRFWWRTTQRIGDLAV